MKRENALDPGDIEYYFSRSEYPEVVHACEEILLRIPDEKLERFTEHFEEWFAEISFKATPAIWSLTSAAALTIGLVAASEAFYVRETVANLWGGNNVDRAIVGGAVFAALLAVSSTVTSLVLSMIDRHRRASRSILLHDTMVGGNEFIVLEAMSKARCSLEDEMERDIEYQEELIARVRRRS